MVKHYLTPCLRDENKNKSKKEKQNKKYNKTNHTYFFFLNESNHKEL